jgi:Uncharacterised protein family (UPF0158)
VNEVLVSMSATVQLKDIVDALELQFDEMPSFVDRDSGEVYTVPVELLHDAEECEEDEEPDLPEWQKDEWEVAKRIVSTDRFVRLPSNFDVHEWAIMEEFSLSVESDRIREELLDAINGRGAFRSFKSAIRRHRIEQAWYKFREESLKEIAIEWCKEHGIAWK